MGCETRSHARSLGSLKTQRRKEKQEKRGFDFLGAFAALREIKVLYL
jgi:hypothetical protein